MSNINLEWLELRNRHSKRPIQAKKFPKKSLWNKKRPKPFEFICPCCRVDRKLPYSPRPESVKNFMRVGLTTAFFMVLTWSFWTWKGVIAFVPFWIAFETYYRLRVRMNLNCPQCGFDPYLYLTDLDRARKEIDGFWRARFDEKGIPYPEKEESLTVSEDGAQNTEETEVETEAEVLSEEELSESRTAAMS